MADKHHSGRKVKKNQRSLYERQRSVLCASPGNDPPEPQKAAIFKIDNIDSVVDDTIRQNGAIDTQKSALDKDSKVLKEYDEIQKNNDMFM
ncbi:MAG: hypothetical protein IK081_12900 [Lachnospiraceae bacterium]|nr:hypothetical protein [Lachnospiraceae bacterium]